MYKVKFNGVYYVDAESEKDASNKVLSYLSDAKYKDWHGSDASVFLGIEESVEAVKECEEFNESLKVFRHDYTRYPRKIGGQQRY